MTQSQIKNKTVADFMDQARVLGGVHVVIFDTQEKFNAFSSMASELFDGHEYVLAYDYQEVLKNLSTRTPSCYIEKDIALNPLIMSIVQSYNDGIVSMMDRTGHTGLVTIKFDPGSVSLILFMTSSQIENSNKRLLEYIDGKELVYG